MQKWHRARSADVNTRHGTHPTFPIYSGPYKFAGLPGLIMQISSDDNDYIWTCVGLEKGRPGDMITTYKAHNMKEKGDDKREDYGSDKEDL